MKNNLLTAIVLSSLGFIIACAGAPAPPPQSGIDVRLHLGADPSAPRPEGVLRVQGVHNGVSASVPVAPLDATRNTQRLPLPPGSYSVSYSPVILEGALGSLRNRAAAKILSANPFLIEIGEGQFHAIDVRAVTGAPSAAAASRTRPLARR